MILNALWSLKVIFAIDAKMRFRLLFFHIIEFPFSVDGTKNSLN